MVKLIQPSEHRQVLETGEVLVHGGVLARQADDRSDLLRLLNDIEAGYGGAAAIGPPQGGQDAHRCRLAGTVGP